MKPAGRLLVFVGLAIVLSLAGYVFVSRDTTSKKTDNNDGKLVVAATIFPIYDLVRQVAGDNADVILVLPPGASPHTYEPLPTDARALSNVDVLFKIGNGLDDWSENLIGPNIFVAQVGLETYEGQECYYNNTCDPHSWMSPMLATNIVNDIRTTLINLDPSHEEFYDAQTKVLTANLLLLNEEINTTINSLTNKHILTFHDAFQYFANEYDLDIVGTFEPSPGREPTAQDLAKLNDLVREFNIKTVYTEPQSSTSGVQAFIQDLNLEVKVLDDLGGVEGRETYQDLIRYNANIIASANP